MFASKAGAYPREALSGAPLEGRFLALPANIRLGWKGLSVTNTLAYYKHTIDIVIKWFITFGPG
jgi:hypothetical protein